MTRVSATASAPNPTEPTTLAEDGAGEHHFVGVPPTSIWKLAFVFLLGWTVLLIALVATMRWWA